MTRDEFVSEYVMKTVGTLAAKDAMTAALEAWDVLEARNKADLQKLIAETTIPADGGQLQDRRAPYGETNG